MTQQEAIQVLMLSPIYFKLTLPDRKQLIHDYCALSAEVDKQYEGTEYTNSLQNQKSE